MISFFFEFLLGDILVDFIKNVYQPSLSLTDLLNLFLTIGNAKIKLHSK